MPYSRIYLSCLLFCALLLNFLQLAKKLGGIIFITVIIVVVVIILQNKRREHTSTNESHSLRRLYLDLLARKKHYVTVKFFANYGHLPAVGGGSSAGFCRLGELTTKRNSYHSLPSHFFSLASFSSLFRFLARRSSFSFLEIAAKVALAKFFGRALASSPDRRLRKRHRHQF